MHIIIIGCGRVGAQLARLLSEEGHNIVVVDQKLESFERVGQTFNGITLTGNGCNSDVLKNANIEKADVVCALTDSDNTNIMASQIAKKIFNVRKVIARVYDPQKAAIYKTLGLDTVSGTIIFAAGIRDKIVESNFSSYLTQSQELGVLEIAADKKLVGKRIDDLNIPGQLIITAIIDNTGTTIPALDTIIRSGQRLMAVVKMKNLAEIKERFRLK